MKLNIDSVLLLAVFIILLCLTAYGVFALRIIKLGSESVGFASFYLLAVLSFVSFGLMIALFVIKFLRKVKK